MKTLYSGQQNIGRMAKSRAGRTAQKSSSTGGNTGKTYFLGIGIDQYQSWSRLHNAVRDVKAVKALLIEDYGLRAEHTFTLFDENATRTAIIHMLEDMADRIGSTDSLLVYYAGHGHLNERQRGYWVPSDAPRDGISYYISNSTIRDYLGDIRSLHTLLISDACFSGSLFVRGERSGDLAANELAKLSSRWAICSGRHDEVVADGPKDGHSPFAESILDVLKHTDRPVITANFLFEQVRDQTRANYDQLPDGGPIQGVGHKRGQFIFRRNKTEGHVWAEAQQTNTPEAYRHYLSLFPAAAYAQEAQQQLQQLAGDKAWQLLTALPTERLKEVDQALQRIRHFCQDYPEHEQFSAAAKLGQDLEYKRQLLENFNSEFGLLAFAQKNTPYQQAAQQRLRELQEQAAPASKQTPEKEAAAPVAKFFAGGVAEEVRPREDSPPPTKRSWVLLALAGLVIVVLVGWGISRMLGGSSSQADFKQRAKQTEERLYEAMKRRDAQQVKRLREEYLNLPNVYTNELAPKVAEQWLVNYQDSLNKLSTQVEEPPEATAAPGRTTKRYMVIAGTYRERANAEHLAQRLRGVGFDDATVEVFDNGEYSAVVVGKFDEITAARKVIAALKEKGVEAFVKRGK